MGLNTLNEWLVELERISTDASGWVVTFQTWNYRGLKISIHWTQNGKAFQLDQLYSEFDLEDAPEDVILDETIRKVAMSIELYRRINSYDQ